MISPAEEARVTQAAMVPYKRTPPPLAMRLFFAG